MKKLLSLCLVSLLSTSLLSTPSFSMNPNIPSNELQQSSAERGHSLSATTPLSKARVEEDPSEPITVSTSLGMQQNNNQGFLNFLRRAIELREDNEGFVAFLSKTPMDYLFQIISLVEAMGNEESDIKKQSHRIPKILPVETTRFTILQVEVTPTSAEATLT